MKKENVEHKQGKPWTVKAKFESYEGAKKFVADLQSQENFLDQIKIKFSRSLNLFLVKTRLSKKE